MNLGTYQGMTSKKKADAEKVDPIEKARQKEQDRAVEVGSPTVPPKDPDVDNPGVPPGTVGA